MLLIYEFSTGIGVYMLVSAVTKDIKNDMIAFSKCIKSEPNPVPLMKKLVDAIDFHSKVKRYKYKI